MIILIAKLDEQLKTFKSTYLSEQTAEQNIEKEKINKMQVCCQEWDSNPRLQE